MNVTSYYIILVSLKLYLLHLHLYLPYNWSWCHLTLDSVWYVEQIIHISVSFPKVRRSKLTKKILANTVHYKNAICQNIIPENADIFTL